ncbi:MAG TPA: GNAT family N-acetyltransferase [Coriobacteriia bacterium]|nr:GNAT family N-acetyltransferase [Coriobacteriia bacterium]
MNARVLRPASPDEAAALWPTVEGAHLFATAERYRTLHAAAPWRLQVTGQGEAAVLETWRDHLDVLAVRALWCADSRVPELVRQIARIARDRGYGRILSPLVSQEFAPAYLRGGLRPWETLVVSRLHRIPEEIAEQPLPPGVTIRLARGDDLVTLARIDAAAFDEFWRYDERRLAGHLRDDRVAVAERSGETVGYTLAMPAGHGGTVGRLAVSQSSRRQGVGEALLREALAHLAASGVRAVTLCTQEANPASRALYRKAGMTESPRRLVFLMGSVAHASERE